MRVTRLEIFGFKSFMNRLVLPLEGGITGIVGPNGCGKSNIVDAIRWVLGETKASSLRGSSLEDVIFNGTNSLRPLGLAEVTMTLRANTENFFSDLVSPQLEVDSILKNLELKLNQDSLINSSLEELSNNQETSTLFDINQQDLPKEDQLEENELEDDEQEVSTSLLSRFSWLKSVSEVQITRRLYRSGESEFFINRVACRLKDIKDFLRAVGLGTKAYTIVAQGEVSRIVTSKPQERRAIIEEAAGVIGLKEKITASKRKLEDTAQNLTRLNDIITEVERQVNSLKKQAQRAQNRQFLKEQLENFDILIFKEHIWRFSKNAKTHHAQCSEITNQIEALNLEISSLELQDQSVKNESSIYDIEANELRLKIDNLQQELLFRARSRSENQQKISEIKAFNQARLNEVKGLEERLLLLNQRLQESSAGQILLKQKESDLQSEIEKIIPVSEDDLKNLGLALRHKRDLLKEKEALIRSNRDQVVSGQTSIKTLQEQIVSASAITQLKKNTIGKFC